MKKTDPKMRALAGLTHAVERPQRERAEVEQQAARASTLDPYADHAMQIGATRIFDQQRKTFVMRPAATCSCGRLSDAVTTEYEAILAVRAHALEVSLVRLARFVGLDLDLAPTALERAKGGDASAIAALEARDEIMAGVVASAEAGEPVSIPIPSVATAGHGLAPDDLAESVGRTTGSFVADPADAIDLDAELAEARRLVELVAADFCERCDAVGLDPVPLHATATELAEGSALSVDQALERVFSDALRANGPRIATPGEPLPEATPAEDAQPIAPLEGSLWACPSCDHRNELENEACANCAADRPEKPEYVVPLDPEVAHAMLGEQHPLVRAAKGIVDTDPEHRGIAWDPEQIAVTGGTAPDPVTEPDA